MCLGIPARVVQVDGSVGKAEIGGVSREVDLRLVEDIGVGDYVILHAGFAIQKLDQEEAHETLSLLEQMFRSEPSPRP